MIPGVRRGNGRHYNAGNKGFVGWSNYEGIGANNTVTVPAAALPGDMLVMWAHKVGNTTNITTPTGWTQLWNTTFGTARYACFYRIMQSGDTTWSVNGSTSLNLIDILAFRGVTAVDVSSSNLATGSSSTITTPSVTTTVDGDLVVRMGYMSVASVGTTSWAGPRTPIVDYKSTNNNNRLSWVVDEQPVAGASGTVVVNNTTSGPRYWSTIALKP